ncbi:MAG: insulinase family protein [Flavobacterium sp.]|nr:MAG: insulinase family protein [Flavobacterium sp.]
MKITKTSILFILLAIFSVANAQEVIELKQPQSNKIIIKLMFRNGSVSDPVGKEGLTNLTASLMDDGSTKTMTKQQITDMLYPWAAYHYASVDKEVSVFTFAVPTVFLDKFYPVIKGLILDPGFSQADFDRIKSNLQNYVDEGIRSNSDEEYGKKALEAMLFQGTNYAHLTEGNSKSVKSLTIDDVKAQYKKVFNRNNLTIGIAGNYTPAFLSKLKADMATLPQGGAAIVPGKAQNPDGINIQIISKENALGSAISGGFPFPITRSDDDFAAMMVANSWMGEHRKSMSHLYQKIREARSMNYGDYTYIEWYENGGSNMLPSSGVPRKSNYFSFWLRPVQTAKGLKGQYPELSNINVGHAHFAVRMVLKEMDNVINNGLPESEFMKVRDFLRSYIKLYIQSPELQLGFLMDSHFYGRKNYIAEMDALLGKLTSADVNKAIKKYWQTKNMDIVVVTDKTEAEPLAKSFREGLESPMSYSNSLKSSLSPAILEEDKQVQNYPMKVHNVVIVDSDKMFRE